MRRKLFDCNQLRLLFFVLHFFWNLQGQDSVLKSGLDVILGNFIAYIEATVAGAGVTLFVDAFSAGVFFFLMVRYPSFKSALISSFA